jgi:hypothetical protein
VLDIVCVCVGFVTRGEKAWDEDLQTNWTETTNATAIEHRIATLTRFLFWRRQSPSDCQLHIFMDNSRPNYTRISLN